MEEEEFPVLKYTVQLYYLPIDGSDEVHAIQIASGVLLKYDSKYLLVTCKHVFDDINVKDVFIMIEFGFAVRLPNSIKFISGENDNIDLAIIEFKGYKVKALKSAYSFLPSKYVGSDHYFDEELYYMLFGFINSKTKRNGYEFYVESFAFMTNIINHKNFEEGGYNYTNNITLEYNRRKQSDFFDDERKLGFKNLTGLSGGGVWLSVAGRKPGTYNFF